MNRTASTWTSFLEPQRVRMFILTNKLLSVWDYSFVKVHPPKGLFDHWVGKWRIQGIFPSPFGEPFRVVACGEDYYFVTNGGEVYCTREDQRKTWTTREVWKDRSRPIIAVLADGVDDRSFVFGKDFFFKLAKKIDAKPCRDVTKREAKELNKDLENLLPAARLAYECGRVLHETGQLKPASTEK